MNKIDEAFKLINLFHDHNHEAYLVGGSVRDLLMSREIKDIDITTDATPSKIIEVANKNNLKYIETGIKHGTITIIYKDIPMEVTTFRVDKDCDGRHCEVEFVKSLEEDLSRRDFTINAIAIDINGDPIDMFNGVMDIENKIIKAVGDPLTRFEEDKLRALRAIRFATSLNFDIEQHTYNAIKNVNTELIDLYWKIGNYISIKIENEEWGKSVVSNLAVYLQNTLPDSSGYSAQNLWRMKQFYEAYRQYSKLSTLLRELEMN